MDLDILGKPYIRYDIFSNPQQCHILFDMYCIAKALKTQLKSAQIKDQAAYQCLISEDLRAEYMVM